MSKPTEGLANYEAIELLGSGHFGIVYRARNLGTNGLVALKIVESHTTEQANEVLREARNIQAAANRHTIKINTAFNIEQNGKFLSLIDMPLISGGTVEKLYKNDQLAIRDILKCIRHILNGLHGIHAAGIIHKDVKPGNILVDKGHFLLGDFGLADASNSLPLSNLAYLRHHPPELNNHHILYDKTVIPLEKYDIYATGMTLYRLLLPKADYEIATQKYSDWCRDPKKKTLPNFCGYPKYIPRKLKKIIEKATSLDRDKRYSSAQEMKRAVEKLQVKINWFLPPTYPIWESALELSKTHRLHLKACSGKTEFKYTINNRRPQTFTVINESYPDALNACHNFVRDNILE